MIAMLFFAAGLAAQTGLFGLSFGDSLNKADSLMSYNGFVAEEVEGSMVKYFSKYNHLVDSVVLFVDPVTEIMVGWFVKYKQENSDKQDDYVIQRLHEMHGNEVRYDDETDQFIWVLGNTQTLHAQYVLPNNLCVLYYDSIYSVLFELPTRHWRSVKRD